MGPTSRHNTAKLAGPESPARTEQASGELIEFLLEAVPLEARGREALSCATLNDARAG
jgi:hypothetical protein